MSGATEMRRAVYLSAATYSIFPVLVLWYLWLEPPAAPGFVIGPLLMFRLILTGRWDLVSYALRFVFFMALLVPIGYRAGFWPAILFLICFVAISVLLRRQPADKGIDLEFPLRRGIYYIAHGGSSSFINRHHASDSQRFALDFVALGFLGARATSIYPERLGAYRIFARPVHSPCQGTVTAVVDGLPDAHPGDTDKKNPAGNHIVIRYEDSDIYIGLAHLMKGSVLVRPAEPVRAGQLLARVGNSGHSSEPHLHLHAKRGGNAESMLDGEGVPVRLGGRWLIRNSLVHV
jgi:Peptidase family M23